MARLVFLFIFSVQLLQAQTYQFGALVKGSLNVTGVPSEVAAGNERKIQQSLAPGIGIYVAKIPDGHFGYSANVLLSRSKYHIFYTKGSNTFLDADIRFTEVNANLEWHIHKSGRVRPYFFGGAQFLYRRYGEERYRNGIIDHTYWPSERFNLQLGFGIHLLEIGNFSLHPMLGVRVNPNEEIIYDTALDQYFLALAATFGIQGRKKNPYNRCPNNF